MKPLKLELELKSDTINGFSYSFTKCLLAKLKEMMEKGDVINSGRREWSGYESFSPLAATLINYISDQVPGARTNSDGGRRQEVERLIKTTEEFLEIFESYSLQGPIDPEFFSIRVNQALKKVGISRWEELARVTQGDLLRENFGILALKEVIKKLRLKGIKLKES